MTQLIPACFIPPFLLGLDRYGCFCVSLPSLLEIGKLFVPIYLDFLQIQLIFNHRHDLCVQETASGPAS
jgi:hypothetical protein